MDDLINDLAAWTEGKLPMSRSINLFAYLIRRGEAWKFDGHTAREAGRLIEEGIISPEGEVLIELAEENNHGN